MQGSQRHVDIFSATCSNSIGRVGFVDNEKRLNVSLTRARFVNIVVADSPTIMISGLSQAALPPWPTSSNAPQRRPRKRRILTLEGIYKKCAERVEEYARLGVVKYNHEQMERTNGSLHFTFNTNVPAKHQLQGQMLLQTLLQTRTSPKWRT